MKAIEYVINGDKTDECKYVTGINVSENAKNAFEDFRLNFEMNTGERFNKLSLPENGSITQQFADVVTKKIIKWVNETEVFNIPICLTL